MISGEAKKLKVLVESIKKHLRKEWLLLWLGLLKLFLGDSRNSSFEDQKQLALLVMETLTVLLQGSNTNAGK